MSIFQKLFGKPKADPNAVLARCDLLMARDEIIDFHKIINAQGEAESGAYYFRNEYVAAWETFRDKPTVENARALLEVAPPLLRYFEDCVPGTSFYQSNAFLKKHQEHPVSKLTDEELTLFVMVSHDLDNPTALEALRELAQDDGLDFDKILQLARNADLPPPKFARRGPAIDMKK